MEKRKQKIEKPNRTTADTEKARRTQRKATDRGDAEDAEQNAELQRPNHRTPGRRRYSYFSAACQEKIAMKLRKARLEAIS
jgi:hypothetical protein